MENNYSYIIISAARNEAKYIEKTIQSVIHQTILPLKWVIVSDASSDGTDQIVLNYASMYSWIKLLRREEEHRRDFAGKVYCFNLGYDYVKKDLCDFIVNIDADISFEKDFFHFFFQKFNIMPTLGLAGGMMKEESYDPLKDSVFDFNDVFGACHIFRRRCYEEIGGYVPIKGGGIDWVAVKMARIKGWETRTFKEKVFFHHHPMGMGEKDTFYARYDYGKKDYNFGNLFLWEILRALFHMTRKPYFIGGLLIFAGYMTSWLNRKERTIPPEVLKFHRKNQQKRLLNMFRKVFLLTGMEDK